MSTLPGSGGKDGIRTHGCLATSTVFETAPFVHSGTLPLGSIAAGGGEGAEQGGAFGGEDGAVDFDAGGVSGVADEVEQGGDGDGPGVGGGEDQAGDPGLDEGAGAHGAGFEGDDQGAAVQAPGAEGGGGGSQDLQLGVGGGVVLLLAAVAAAGELGAVVEAHPPTMPPRRDAAPYGDGGQCNHPA